jgi:hypothetical protein
MGRCLVRGLILSHGLILVLLLDIDATFNQSGGRGVTPRSLKIGIANITTYVSA